MTREEEIINAANELCNSFRGSKTYKLGFEIGVKWADEHPKSPWISVEDDLPCNHEELLNAKYETKEVFILKSIGFPDVDYMLKVNGEWTWFTYKSTKFWMPIPELPKE